MGCVHYALLASVVWLSSCTTPPPPEAWEAADVMAQGHADRVARLKGKESRREQQIAAEGILLSYQADLAPSLRELCGPRVSSLWSTALARFASRIRTTNRPLMPSVRRS